jgi:hypothetical protein
MSRFKDMKALDSVVSEAALTANNKQALEPVKEVEPVKAINRMIYNVNPMLFKAIENSSESFSSFAKRAMEKVAREEGKLK